ncbi:MAG: nucleoside triphosphate pyrophosphohydrolase [Bdellovibrionota bacterium]
MAERDGLSDAVKTVEALRGPGGCPWDRAQTHTSLRKYLLEETYETLEALDALAAGATPERVRHFKEELGDLLLQVLLHSEIARQNGDFSIQDVAGELSDKLVRRHPHVFGGERLDSAEEVVGAWDKNKQAEKPSRESILEGIPAALPALQRSLKVIEKVSKVGFQWPDLNGPFEKMREELGEFEAEVSRAGGAFLTREAAGALPPEVRQKLEGELGDLLFTVANVAHFLQLNPEDSLRSMLARFESRFRGVEGGARAAGRNLEEMSLAEMDVLWDEAKKRERG